MKLLYAIVFCVCFVQVLAVIFLPGTIEFRTNFLFESGGKDKNDEDIKWAKMMEIHKAIFKENENLETPDIVKIQRHLNGSDAVKDVSPQFVENVNIVLEKYQNNTFVTYMIEGIVSELKYL